MKNIFYIIVFIILLSSYSLAQEEPNSSGEEGAAIPENTISADNEQTESTPQNTANPNFDVFRPSEDISEDLAVPFPVDI